MSRILIPLTILCLLLLALDLYVFKGLRLLTDSWSPSARRVLLIVYWTVSILMVCSLFYNFMNLDTIRDTAPKWWLFSTSIWFVFFFPKMGFSILHLLEDAFHIGVLGVNKVASTDFSPERRDFLSKMGLGIGALLMGAVAYGVTKGKFAWRVLSEEVPSSRLPKSFDGLRIVHLSDAHLGSFVRNYGPIDRMVDMVNALEPDYIVFTGDMVNTHAEEAEGWEPVFARLKAKEGKYSIFGNHDYAKYGNFTEEEREDSIRRLKNVHREMGFRLMEDENVLIERGGDRIRLLGVHNWGPGFGEYGDLDKALEGTAEEEFKVLLSHDPSHYDQKVLGKAAVDLTLSGHTHGMQMGIEVPSLGIKWSPVSLRYKRWAGLYEQDGQYLYVNRGMGVLGLPGRIGMPPEITCLDLRSV